LQTGRVYIEKVSQSFLPFLFLSHFNRRCRRFGEQPSKQMISLIQPNSQPDADRNHRAHRQSNDDRIHSPIALVALQPRKKKFAQKIIHKFQGHASFPARNEPPHKNVIRKYSGIGCWNEGYETSAWRTTAPWCRSLAAALL
jgi:hypothetical protein